MMQTAAKNSEQQFKLHLRLLQVSYESVSKLANCNTCNYNR